MFVTMDLEDFDASPRRIPADFAAPPLEREWREYLDADSGSAQGTGSGGTPLAVAAGGADPLVAEAPSYEAIVGVADGVDASAGVVARGGAAAAAPVAAPARRAGRPPEYLAVLQMLRDRGDDPSPDDAPDDDLPIDLGPVPIPADDPEAAVGVLAPFPVAPGGEDPADDDTTPDLQLVTSNGFLCDIPLANAVSRRVEALRESPEHIDASKSEACISFLREARCLSLHHLATEKGATIREYRTTVTRFVLMWYLWCRERRRRLERGFSAPAMRSRVMFYLEQMRYDVTPLWLRTLERFSGYQ